MRKSSVFHRLLSIICFSPLSVMKLGLWSILGIVPGVGGGLSRCLWGLVSWKKETQKTTFAKNAGKTQGESRDNLGPKSCKSCFRVVSFGVFTPPQCRPSSSVSSLLSSLLLCCCASYCRAACLRAHERAWQRSWDAVRHSIRRAAACNFGVWCHLH